MEKRIYKTESALFRTLMIIFCILFGLENSMAQGDAYDLIPSEKWNLFNEMAIVSYYVLHSDEGGRFVFREECAGENPDWHKTIDGKDYVINQIYGVFDKSDRDHSNQRFYFYYRLDGTKVYRYNEQQKKDVLLMDFGLAVGDLFDSPSGVQLKVVEIGDTIIERGTSRKVLTLRGTKDESVWDKWVESYGSARTGLHLVNDIPNYQITDLLFVEKENRFLEYLYASGIYNDINNNYLRAVSFDRKDLSNEESVVSSNQDYYVNEKGFNFMWKPKSDKIYTIILKENDSDLKFHKIAVGNYQGKSGNAEGSDLFQLVMDCNFTSGTYTLEDSDGNVQNITIGGDADAIDAIENDASTSKQGNGSLFDLTGRRLSAAPQHGIYIQDGRKVFK